MKPSSENNSKILSSAALAPALRRLRRAGKKIVFTNGCFDILHVGHVRYLSRARKLGGALIVGVNTDRSVKRLKGPERPVTHEKDRVEVLAALGCVDHVVLFGEPTPEKLIQAVRPDVLVKGGDWKVSQIAGSPFVMSYGGKVKALPYYAGFSTTGLIEKIKKI